MSNTIIRASAGSGKTFRLSNEFLNVVFQSDKSVGQTLDTILASTFTRKAAGEITDRIFTKLADAALDPAKRKELEKHLHYPKSGDQEKTLQNILAELARNMYRLRVGTLDAYFNKIATAFSLELGLPPGWTMLDQTEYPRLIDEAVREVFSESRRSDAKRLLHLLQKGEEKANMMNDLVALADAMLPLVRVTTQDAWEHETPKRLEPHTHDLVSATEIDEILKRLEAITDDQLPRTRENEPRKNYMSAREKLKIAISSQDWPAFLKLTLVKNVIPTLNDPTAPCVYDNADVREEAPELFDIVTKLLPHAKSILIKILIGQTRSTYGLLKMVAEKLDVILERERKFRYEDITRRIADYGFKNRLDSLQHRLNAETRHLLLDEFQDTSLPQWTILEPLALKTTGDKNGTYFCVGDEKQSIYSWRGGEAAIFGSMKNRLRQELQDTKIDEETLEVTRRCAKPIIETVNELFEKIQYSDTVCRASEKAGACWQNRFKLHDTANEKPGYCVLEESPPKPKSAKKTNDPEEETGETKDTHLDYVVDRIERLIPLVRNNPDLPNGIGVLVTTNKFGAKIVSALSQRGIETAGNGAKLLQSPAVRHIISALTFAEHPGDTLARFHLAHGPLADKIGLNKLDDSICSHHIRNELVHRGYGAVVGDYIEALAVSCNAIEMERLEKLREIAWRFDEDAAGIRTRRFIDLVKEERIANHNAANVQVMTVYGAKGLEFDIVVLPELDDNIKGRTGSVPCVTKNIVTDDPASPVEFVLRYANEELQSVLPKEYQAVFESRIQREVEESLCVLYVAMTRAVRSLIMIVPYHEKNKNGSDKKSDGTNFASILRELPREKNPRSANILYEHGDPNWSHGVSETIMESFERTCDELTFHLKESPVLHHVPRITPSKLHETAAQMAPAKKEKASHNSDDAAIKGIALHACFEHGVEWLDDAQTPDESELRKRIEETLEGRKASFTAEEILDEFRSACRNPELIAALSRSRYFPDENPELERERRFAVWIKQEKIMRGSIDRLVVQRDASGAIVKIEIFDYKTGDSTDVVDALVENYRYQLDAYRQAVCELYGVKADIVETALVFTTLGKVVTIPPVQSNTRKKG